MLGISKTFDLGNGRTVTIETGKMAKQADGSAVVKVGNTMLLATVCCKKEAVENTDFMPLQVEYQEKYAAVGRFPGGFFRREARPSEYEILIARLIDRALRPLFPSNFHAETQVIVTLVSGDKNNLPDAYACLAASSALAVSNIPFLGPISEVRVGRIDGQMVINPTVEEMEGSDIDMIVAASMDNIMMVEGEMKEVSEADMVDALNFAHEAIKKQCQVQLELAAMVEKANPKREYCHEKNDEDMRELVMKSTYDKVYAIAKSGIGKHERNDAFEQILTDFIAENVPEEEQEEKTPMIARYYHDVQYHAVRNMILNERVRLDSRTLEQIRPIWIETGCLPSVHGSAIFTRGETQSLTSCTLGTKLDEQTIDGAVVEGSNRFLLHYNFPPFSVGEVKRLGTGRREVGHGNLAHRALKRMLPLDDVSFPYTVRIVSDILESNGSSSMATVCAGTLALMDCGVKIKKPVSGIAMGLITDEKTGNYAILSDILGDEDHLGDMDFKVCGTADGITACQMDIKINGLSSNLMAEALEQARKGRLFILDKITEAMPAPREDYREFVPRIIQIEIPRDMIGAVIGSAGKVIQEIQRETNTIINIEEKGEFGIVDIAAPNLNDINRAIERIELIIKVPEVGETYHGIVKSVMSFGAFVEILPGTDGLLHVSEIAYHRIDNVEDVLKVGDEVDVKLISVDEKTGKYKLSMRALMPKPEGYVEPEARPKRNNDRDRRGGGRSSNGGGNNRNHNENGRKENHR